MISFITAENRGCLSYLTKGESAELNYNTEDSKQMHATAAYDELNLSLKQMLLFATVNASNINFWCFMETTIHSVAKSP